MPRRRSKGRPATPTWPACPPELLANFRRFKAKWGEERAGGYRLQEGLGVRGQGLAEEDKGSGIRGQGSADRSAALSFLTPNPYPLTPPFVRVSLTMIVRN